MLSIPTPPKSIEDYKDRSVRYIQRCKFETRRADPTQDPELKLILDYMGAAEYEFGATQESRERMRNSNKGRMTLVFEGKTFQVLFAISKEETLDEAFVAHVDWVRKAIGSVVDGTADLKRGSHFQSSLKGPYVERLKKGCKKKMETVPNHSYTEAWWDIQNDWIMWFNKPEFNVVVENLFHGRVKGSVVNRIKKSIVNLLHKSGLK